MQLWASARKQIRLGNGNLQARANPCNSFRGIVAPEGAGSSPVGHPPISSINAKPAA